MCTYFFYRSSYFLSNLFLNPHKMVRALITFTQCLIVTCDMSAYTGFSSKELGKKLVLSYIVHVFSIFRFLLEGNNCLKPTLTFNILKLYKMHTELVLQYPKLAENNSNALLQVFPTNLSMLYSLA